MSKTSVLSIVLAVGLTVFSGVMHGRQSRRWGAGEQIDAAAARLSGIPTEIGGKWKLHSENPLQDNVVRILECHGYVNRIYVNQETGAQVQAVLLLGPAGPTAIHTPEICVPSRNYDATGPREAVRIDSSGNVAELWSSTFKSRSLDGHLLRFYYGWSRGDQWLAPSEPRFTMSNNRYLYKLQAACILPVGAETEREDPCQDFLRAFFLVAQKYLVVPES